MADKVDTRISPALDPEVYRSVEGYDDDTRMFVDSVVNAVNDAHQTLGRIHDARTLAASNPAWTPENRVLIVSQEADKQRERVLRRLALAETDLRANIAHTEQQLMTPLKEQAGQGSLNTEVRNFVRGLDRSEREAFMRDALERNDESTLTAVLGGPHYLSGLTAVDRDDYLRLHHEKQQPQLVRRLDVMQRVLGMFERSVGIVHTQFDKAVGATPSIVKALNRANEQALAALKIEPTE
jgi:hypothetical protein